ncbi:unnamed protein product, partial [Mesorhabditis spiculigera]
MLALSSPWASIIYFPEAYSWDYDYTLEYSWVVQKVEMVIEVGGIFLAAFFYAGVLIILCKTRRRFKSSKNARVELKILIQALVITVYCTVLNVFWHNYQILLPDSLWSYMGLNFMWILNSGIYPIIYFVVNKTIRDKVKNRNVTRIERSVAPGITNGKFATAVMRTAQMPKPSASASCTESTKYLKMYKKRPLRKRIGADFIDFAEHTRNDIIVNVEIKYKDIDFPSVTVCNLNPYKTSKALEFGGVKDTLESLNKAMRAKQLESPRLVRALPEAGGEGSTPSAASVCFCLI